MRGLITYDEGKTSAPLNRVSLSETERGFNEDWLQRLMPPTLASFPLMRLRQDRALTFPSAENCRSPNLAAACSWICSASHQLADLS